MPCKICKAIGHNSRTCPKKSNDSSKQVVNDIHEQDEPEKKRYYCYILKQVGILNSLTYVGYTVNYNRRIRQHNCIIKGGALYTKHRGPWEFLAILTCSSWTSIRAMQVEWLIKFPMRKRKINKSFRGAKGKILSLVEIFKRIPNEENINMFIHSDFYDTAVLLKLPNNVNLFKTQDDIID